MALRISRSLTRVLKFRHYSSASAYVSKTQGQEIISQGDCSYTELQNGLRVVTKPSDSELVRIGLICGVSSRDDTPGKEGLAHLLRVCAGRHTKGPLATEIVGLVEQRGGNFQVVQTREHTLYSIQCPKEHGLELADVLRFHATAPSFRDIEAAMHQMAFESSKFLYDPQICAFELLHKAAYRHNLGNSLYCQPLNFDAFKSEDIASFFMNTMTLQNMLLVSEGLDITELSEKGMTYRPFRENLVRDLRLITKEVPALQDLELGAGIRHSVQDILKKIPGISASLLPSGITGEVIPTGYSSLIEQEMVEYNDLYETEFERMYKEERSRAFPSKYYGGSERLVRQDKNACVYVAVEGASMGSHEAVVAGVIKHLMGGSIRTKYGSGSDKNRLAQAVVNATNGNCSAAGMNANYTDSGLFGFSVAGTSDTITAGLNAAVKEFRQITKDGSFNAADVEAAKNAYCAEVAMQFEDSDYRFHRFVEQQFYKKTATSLQQTLDSIKSVTQSDVSKLAKKLVNGKPCMSAVGKVECVPYIDQLFS